jgi:hypothetical protein
LINKGGKRERERKKEREREIRVGKFSSEMLICSQMTEKILLVLLGTGSR